MKRDPTVLTAREPEIVKLVWNLGEATVRDVYEALPAKRRIAHTAVMTTTGTLDWRRFSAWLRRASWNDQSRRPFVWESVGWFAARR
jgi:hypothetical protein